ncbi:uncharacterized protein LOC131239467 [Magnolia sinica]|uniref:uncharacterized protein LOC131239467 n=1 Tax=Magnolia sinica TaxID=86752 RepID=UPI0026593981|nr:uncharacterized protein LOC131239467 [Magnolia sinica]
MESKANVRREAKDNVELLHLAIQQLIEEKGEEGRENASASEEERRILLSRLLSQLESLKEDAVDQPEPSTETEAVTSSGALEADLKDENGGPECVEMRMEDIVRELRIVRRQNTITHWLLSVLITVTAIWQLSEVSILMMMKNTFKNPFKAVGNLITGALRGRSNETNAGKSSSSSKQTHMEALSLNPFKVPELPYVGFPYLGLDSDDD